MEASIGAGEFKAQCLRLLNEVAERRESLIITKRGKPIAKVVPIEPEQALFGAMRSSVVEAGDLVSPIDVEWEAAR